MGVLSWIEGVSRSVRRKKVYDSVQLTTGGIVMCLWMASYTVPMAELEEALHVVHRN